MYRLYALPGLSACITCTTEPPAAIANQCASYVPTRGRPSKSCTQIYFHLAAVLRGPETSYSHINIIFHLKSNNRSYNVGLAIAKSVNLPFSTCFMARKFLESWILERFDGSSAGYVHLNFSLSHNIELTWEFEAPPIFQI